MELAAREERLGTLGIREQHDLVCVPMEDDHVLCEGRDVLEEVVVPAGAQEVSRHIHAHHMEALRQVFPSLACAMHCIMQVEGRIEQGAAFHELHIRPCCHERDRGTERGTAEEEIVFIHIRLARELPSHCLEIVLLREERHVILPAAHRIAATSTEVEDIRHHAPLSSCPGVGLHVPMVRRKPMSKDGRGTRPAVVPPIRQKELSVDLLVIALAPVLAFCIAHGKPPGKSLLSGSVEPFWLKNVQPLYHFP